MSSADELANLRALERELAELERAEAAVTKLPIIWQESEVGSRVQIVLENMQGYSLGRDGQKPTKECAVGLLTIQTTDGTQPVELLVEFSPSSWFLLQPDSARELAKAILKCVGDKPNEA